MNGVSRPISNILIGLRCITGEQIRCSDCPYKPGNRFCKGNAAKDAIEALDFIAEVNSNFTSRKYGDDVPKAISLSSEPVEPIIGTTQVWGGEYMNYYQCGACRNPIDHHDKFCRTCGKELKWS